MNQGGRLSVRARLTLFFVLGILVLATVVGVALVALVRQSASNQDQADISQYMTQVQEELVAMPAKSHEVILPSNANVVIQVVNVDQTQVWAASPQIEDEPLLAKVHEDTSTPNGLAVTMLSGVSRSNIDSQLSAATVATITTQRGPGLMFGFIYGQSVTRSVRLLITSLLISIPVLLFVAGVLVWLGIGLALAPVESIRRRVDDIAGRDLTQRVPVPGGNDEISRLARTVNEMLSRLESSTQFQQEFVSNASHELRSPLTTLLTTTQRAQQNPEGANWQEVADVVAREGRRLDRLIDDLFWLTRNDEGQIARASEDVDIDDLLFEEAQRVRTISDFTVDVSGVKPTRITGDPSLLKRLVRNLVDNALRYVDVQLTFRCEYQGEYAVLWIANDGESVDVSTSYLLFQRFVRADDSRDRASGGTGLGLSIVQGIAERHGGSAAFKQVPIGTEVEIRLRRDGRTSQV